MAQEKLEIVVGADVQEVVQKLDQISKVAKTSMESTATSFEPVKKALKKVQVEAFDTDKAFREAMDRISSTVDKNIDNAIKSFQALDKSVDKTARQVKTLQDKFREFGGISSNNAAKGLEAINKAAAQTSAELPKLTKATGQGTQTLINFGRVVQDAPFGIIGIANNIDPLIQSFTSLKASTGSAGAAFKALAGSLIGPAGIALAISTVTSLLIVFAQNKQRAASETKKLKEEEDVYVNTLAKEKTTLDNLFAVATSANVPLKARTEAIKELRQNYGAYLKDFSDEEILAGKAATAYQKLAAALINVARAKAAEAQQIENSKKILANEEKIAQIREQAQKDAANARNRTQQISGGTAGTGGSFLVTAADQQATIFKKAREEAEALRNENIKLEEQQKRLADAILKNQVAPFKEAKETVKGTKKEILETVAALNGFLVGVNESFNKTALQIQEAVKLFNPNNFGKLPSVAGNGDRQIQSMEQQVENAKRLAFLIKSVNYDKQIEQAEILSGIINNGINAGIDQFFNAIANNQDPFEALQQSVKRLVAELAAAVVKALLLQAITAAFSGGSSLAVDGGGLISGVLRGDNILLSLFRSSRD
jgi:hypothetical protein